MEAHALYEKTAALARATSSRRLLKLRPSPSSPSGWALATQQSIPLHKLMSQVSLAANSAKVEEHSSCQAVQPTQRHSSSSRARFVQPLTEPTDVSPEIASKAQGHASLGREAQLLNAPFKQTSINGMVQRSQPEKLADAAKTSSAGLDEAVVFEEKYHRAGRDVLGQRIDANAIKAAANIHKRQQLKAQTKRLGFKRIHHNHDVSKDAASSSPVHVSQRYQYASAI